MRVVLITGASAGIGAAAARELAAHGLEVYGTSRRPDAVVFSSAREDALRRDFTVNGMFFDPLANQLIDYVGGRDDLQARVLRAIGDPATRFAEDKLRYVPAENLIGKAQFIFFSTDGSARVWEFWRWPFAIRYSRLFTRIH